MYSRGDDICSKYGYTVRYTGVGAGPDGTEHLGMCSQIAVFERDIIGEDNDDSVQRETNEADSLPYDVVGNIIGAIIRS